MLLCSLPRAADRAASGGMLMSCAPAQSPRHRVVLGGREGFSAQAVFDALQPEELLQSGIVLPIAAVTPTGATTGALLAQWLSTAYIALAQVLNPV